MHIREMVDRINDAPTMMVWVEPHVWNTIMVKPAMVVVDGNGFDELRGYVYRGWMEPYRWRGWLVEKDGEADRRFTEGNDYDPVVLQRESVLSYHMNGCGATQAVHPFLTEYDFIEPEDGRFPPWLAMLWVKFREMEMREGKTPEEGNGLLKERLTKLRERLGDEREVLKEVDPPGFRRLREALERADRRDGEEGERGDP